MVLTGRDFDEFVGCVYRKLPKSIPFDSVYSSCLHLAGEELTAERLAKISWRLAGNIPKLKSGHAVTPWSGVDRPEWVPVQVLSADFDVSKRGKFGATLRMRVLAGSPCTEELSKFWTTAYCHTFAARMGFSRFPSGPHPFEDVRELVNLRFYIEIAPHTPKLEFEHLQVPGTSRNWNLKYIRRRSRVGWSCPEKKPDSLPCFRCNVGQDRCPVSVHPSTYIRRECFECCKPAWFENQEALICVDCTNKKLIQDRVRKP